MTKNDLGGKTYAKAILSWEWASADTFENRTFACRLVTTYYNLGQRNVIANPKSSNTVDLVESFEGLGRS
jgi:hypothetical protein